MVSPELIRRYPFFAGLNQEQIAILAKAAKEEEAEAGHYFVREKEHTPYLYLVIDGSVTVVVELPKQDREIVVGTVGPGDVFAWSALVPPHIATAGVKATAACGVLAIDCRQLLEVFEDDPRFGYLMMTRAAQVTRDRVVSMTIETLAYLAE
jgi:CRP/FNR family cyclic AMP-dependent transcriptional regulator